MISMQEKGRVDIPYMSSLTDLPAKEIIKDLEYVSIFEDMETNSYVPADEYLSGDVRGRMEKLAQQRQKWQREMEGIARELSSRAVGHGSLHEKTISSRCEWGSRLHG